MFIGVVPQPAYGYHTTTAKPQRNTNTHRTRAIQCDNMYMSIFSQHYYIYFLLCVLQHYMFRPSVWAIIRCVWRLSYNCMEEGGGGFVGRGGQISLCGFTYYVMHYVILVLILLMITVARGVPCFYLYDKTAYSRNISTILGRPCLYRSALY